jgi:hypothetical protein
VIGKYGGWGLALAGHWGNITTGRGIAQRQTYNATPEEDYRTALLFDSPDAGCSLCGWCGIGGATRTRSRSAVLRGPGATGPWSLPPLVLTEALAGSATDGKRGTAYWQARGTNPP